jgi:hypothetical protein
MIKRPAPSGARFDAVAVSNNALRDLDQRYSDLQRRHEQLQGQCARLQAENGELVRMLAKLPQESQDAARLAVARLDSAFSRGKSPLRIVSQIDFRATDGIADQARDAVARFFGCG